MRRNLVRRKTKNQPGLVSSVANIQKMLATLQWDGVERVSAYVGFDRPLVSQGEHLRYGCGFKPK